MPTLQNIQKKNFTAPDETRSLPKTTVEVVNLGDATVMKTILEPGWKWSECVKPTAGTASCQVPHLGYVLSGRLKVVMDDGTEEEYGPGDVNRIAPGHDAWVIGDEPFVGLDFTGGKIYAK
jgi:hypothetical protein